VLETYGSFTILVNRTKGVAGAIAVQFATSDGTAVAGVDYTAASGTLSWADQDSNPKSFTVPVLLRGSVTGDFTLTVTLTNPTGGATLVGSPEQSTLTIRRRSNGELDFTPGQWEIQTPAVGPTNIPVTVQRNIAFKGVVGCSWHTQDNTAIAGTDYTGSSGTLSWTDGDGASKTINVPVLHRPPNPDRNFNIIIDTPTGGVVIGSGNTANVIITDAVPPANPSPGPSIKAQLIEDYFSSLVDHLILDESFYVSKNILVNSQARSLSRRFNGIFTFNTTTAWAVGNIGYITLTTDGTTWTQQTSGVNGNLYAVFFASALVGWAVGAGGTILKSIDGGVTWNPQTSGTPKDLFAVNFISTAVGWAVGASGTILKTVNGGTTWVAQTSGTPNRLSGITAIDASNAWAAGAGGVILNTSNGGTAWGAQASGTTNDLNGVFAIDATHVWAAGNIGTILFFNGAAWAAQTSGVTTNLNAIQFASSTTGWAVGGNGTILKTTNGGTAWAAQTSAFNEDLTSIWSASTTTAYLTGFGHIQKTTNGGTNWTISLTVTPAIGFGGMGSGGASSNFGGGIDFLNGNESFVPLSKLKNQGYVN
jgi:photosystem II stability/assembly factor-like uncharacterized protein